MPTINATQTSPHTAPLQLPPDWQQELKAGAAALTTPLDLSPQLLAQFATYTTLLLKWNKTYNLTAIADPHEIITHHILDSLAIAPYVSGTHILDIGSGAGFPGVPLALIFPEKKFVLLDSNNKKARFLRHVVLTLALPNVEIAQQRVEKFHFTPCFDTIVIRATGSIKDLTQQSLHLCCNHGLWLFMKGKYPQEELEEFQAARVKQNANTNISTKIVTETAITETASVLTTAVQSLQVPGVTAARHVVFVQQSKD
jgi:16S rRNA (guanine527-N7)-methyltransferase